MAAILLLWIWVGPVTFIQTDSWQLLRSVGAPERAFAESRVIPAGKTILLEPNTSFELHLRDGSVVEGRFLGRTLLDSALYAGRFETRTGSSSYAPFTLGETLRVSLRDGREWMAPFAGYGERTLLLRSPDGAPSLRAPFEFAREIRRANGDRVEPGDLARAFRDGLLPSAEALALEERDPVGSTADRWAGALRVAVEDIESVTADLPSGTSAAGVVVLSVVISVVLVFVLIGAMLGSVATSVNRGCRSGGSINPLPLSGLHLTTRPFDRDRGCYLGEALAVAAPWPGGNEGGPATALADPSTSRTPTR